MQTLLILHLYMKLCPLYGVTEFPAVLVMRQQKTASANKYQCLLQVSGSICDQMEQDETGKRQPWHWSHIEYLGRENVNF